MDLEAMRRTPGEFRVLEYEVPDFVGDCTGCDYGDPDAAHLRELRQEFALDAVVAGIDREWEQLLALKRWVRSRWDHGWSRSGAEVKTALDILRCAARGEQFNCGYYATVLRECCTALGFPARPVGAGIERGEFPRDYNYGNVGHSVMEAWSNDHRKWVLLDADLNVHYQRAGEPLNALDLHDAWLSGAADGVEMVQDEPGFVIPTGETLKVRNELHNGEEVSAEAMRLTMERFGRHRVLDYYARITVAGRQWVDRRCLPTFIAHFQPGWQLRGSSHPPDLYWSVNLVRPCLTPSWDEDGTRLEVQLQHCMPFFSHYEARIDEAAWARCEESFAWPMNEGLNTLECRAANSRDRRGPAGRIVVAYAGPRWSW